MQSFLVPVAVDGEEQLFLSCYGIQPHILHLFDPWDRLDDCSRIIEKQGNQSDPSITIDSLE